MKRIKILLVGLLTSLLLPGLVNAASASKIGRAHV